VAPATCRAILRAAAELGYRENPVVSHLMHALRQSRSKAYQANLALVSCARSAHSFRWHTNSCFRTGFHDAAGRHGYGVDDFWLNEPGRSHQQLARILYSRRIAGLALMAARDLDTIQRSYDEIWYDFPVIGIGVVRTRPEISCVCTDHFQTAFVATEEVLRRGYRRPALFVKRGLDRLVDFRFSGGFLAAARQLAPSGRTELYAGDEMVRSDFERWVRREKPDCILTLHVESKGWLEDIKPGLRRPIGLVHLDWNTDLIGWAGMIQDSHRVGETAADLVIQNIHRDRKGATGNPQVVMLESRWRDGASAPGRASAINP